MRVKKINTTPQIDFYSAETSTELELPFAKDGISAGFPSPANDYLDLSLDLNKALIKNPSATFYGKVKGLSMIEAGIDEGDILIIDKSLEPKNNALAVCFIDGEFTLKKIKKEKNKLMLMPANKDYEPINITDDNEFAIWGIVTYVIKKF